MDLYCERCHDTGWARATRGVERCVCWSGNPILAARRRVHAAWLARRHERRRRQRRVVPMSNLPRPVPSSTDPRAVQIGVAAARLAAIALELREEGWRATFSADAQAGTVSVTVTLDQAPEHGER